MVIALVLVFVCGSAANTGSSVPFIPQSQLESEIQILKQQINQEVQLRLELEQTFLMHIRLLRELKEDFIKTVDTLKNELKMNVSSFLKMAEGKVADLELGFMRNLSIARKGAIAFSARLGIDLTSSRDKEAVVFDVIVTNIGSAYNVTSGQFTAPFDGIFAFAWTILTDPGKWFDSELVVDGQVKLYNAADTVRGGNSYESSGCTGVLQLRAGEKVWIRKHNSAGNYLKSPWSSFSGWLVDRL